MTYSFIITLSARELLTEHIANVTNMLQTQNAHIYNIQCLGNLSIVEDAKPKYPDQNGYAFYVSSNDDIFEALRLACLNLCANQNFDVSVQVNNEYRTKRKLVCFDMDSTLIQQEVIVELAKAAGIGDQVAEITESAMRGEIDFNESFTKRVALLKGLSTDVLDDIANNLTITEGAEQLIRSLKAQGYHTAILSGGFTYFAQYLQKKLGIDEVHANILDIEDNVATGKVVLPIVDGQKKAEILQNISKRLNLDLQQVIAVGDGANDLQMLALSGLGIAFRAKPLVREKAKQSLSNLGLDGVLYLLDDTKPSKK